MILAIISARGCFHLAESFASASIEAESPGARQGCLRTLRGRCIDRSILSFYLSTYLCAHLSLYIPIYLPIYPPIRLSSYLSIYLPTYLPTCQPTFNYLASGFPAYLPMCLLTYLPISVSLCLCTCTDTHPHEPAVNVLDSRAISRADRGVYINIILWPPSPHIRSMSLGHARKVQ